MIKIENEEKIENKKVEKLSVIGEIQKGISYFFSFIIPKDNYPLLSFFIIIILIS